MQPLDPEVESMLRQWLETVGALRSDEVDGICAPAGDEQSWHQRRLVPHSFTITCWLGKRCTTALIPRGKR